MGNVRTAIHAAVWSADPEPESVRHVVAAAGEIGYDCLVLPLRDPDRLRPQALARIFEAAGVTPLNSAGIPPASDIGSADPETRRRGREHLNRVLGLARDMGSRQINGVLYAPLVRATRPSAREELLRSSESMAMVAETAEAMGITLGIELVNRYETNMLNCVEQGLEYLDLVDRPNVRLHLDTFHLAIEEADPVAAIAAAMDRLCYFELDQSHRGRLDQGSLDLKRMAQPAVSAGYDGLVGVEAFARSRLAPEHADTLAIWREHFDEPSALAAQALRTINEIFGQGTAPAETPQAGGKDVAR
ncbi:sugar phosphate isomerase/epimerase [Afifella sp. IM 167]|uniref:sugar phosphate isomerase/epimerase family protein n=1 Tax=Afifella sp. IM 167 TaxID=2033586 RepID=UPI001CCC506B|nr:sugar phosphate isomerase/epimerase family protein [Afifella sp. IM 167]